LEIPAFLYLPPGHRKGERIRFLVTFHGGPESQFRPGFRAEIPYFLSRGFGVLAPNVRGSSGYGTEYLEADNYKNRMKSVDDGVACAKWLVKHGYSKEKSIGVYGGSYGGFMVVATATRAPGLFGAACDIVGIVNFQTFLERTKPYRRKLREAEYGPLTDPDFLKSISPLYLVDKMDTPMLIAHGKNDPRVPIDEATQLYEALKSRDKVVELLVFDDEGHGFRKDENRIEFYEKMADFFEQQLKKPSNAPSAGLME
jgi:dipeptidyl aminopeptidase/acylaminoacyl peptidase